MKRVVVWLCLAAASLNGCYSSVEHDPPAAELGQVVMTLAAELDGVRYRLRGSFTLSGPVSMQLHADDAGDQSFLQVTLPVGEYSLRLEEGWALERLIDRVYQPVEARLVGSPEQHIGVQPAEVTHAAFQFELQGRIVDLTRGELRIGIVVAPQQVGPVQVSLGMFHTCALLNTGALRCWGQGTLSQLGHAREDVGDDETPASVGDVPLQAPVSQIALGAVHSCAVLDVGAVRCWGYTREGETGYGNAESWTTRLGDYGDLPIGGTVKQLAAGDYHTCALLTNGSVRCWGNNDSGELGYGHTQKIGDDETPAEVGEVPLGGPAIAIAAGGRSTCALLTGGGVRCWGELLSYGNAQRIGDDETPASAGDIELGAPATQIAVGGVHACALLEGGELRCWGSGGLLGYGHTNSIGDDETPASARAVPLGGQAAQIAAGSSRSTCAVLVNGELRCWGNGASGQLGYGNYETIGDDETPASVGPVPVASSPTPVTAVALGSHHTCALLDHGEFAPASVRCWGGNVSGELGYGTRSGVLDPASAGDVPLL